MRRDCAQCGASFDAKRPAAKFCGDTCRKRAQRAGDAPVVSAAGGATRAAVAAKLEAVDRSETYLAAAALALAARVDETPGSGAATLVRELRLTMAEILAGAPAAADDLDELKRRRALKRAAG